MRFKSKFEIFELGLIAIHQRIFLLLQSTFIVTFLKLNFTFEAESGESFTYEKTELDSLFPAVKSRYKVKNLKFTVPVPCHLKPVPIKEITGELRQNCPEQKVDARSLWNGIFNSGCVEMKLHIRRIKVFELLPGPIKTPHYRASFKPTQSLNDGKKLIFHDSA